MKVKSEDKKKKTSYSKRLSTDQYEESFDVREIDNGYLVSYRKTDKKDWNTIEEKEYYSETNPVEEQAKEDKVKDLLVALDNLQLSPKGVTPQYKK